MGIFLLILRFVVSEIELALPVLLYGSETWTVKASDARRITAAEMKYMRRTAGHTWDRLQNKCTNCKGVKKTPILDKLLE